METMLDKYPKCHSVEFASKFGWDANAHFENELAAFCIKKNSVCPSEGPPYILVPISESRLYPIYMCKRALSIVTFHKEPFKGIFRGDVMQTSNTYLPQLASDKWEIIDVHNNMVDLAYFNVWWPAHEIDRLNRKLVTMKSEDNGTI